MNDDLQKELRSIRNEIAHSARQYDIPEIAARLSKLGVSFSASELPEIFSTIFGAFGPHGGEYFVPSQFLQAISALLAGRKAEVVCDPWAGYGFVLSAVYETTKPNKAIAFEKNEAAAKLGRVILRNSEWLIGNPLRLLNEFKDEFDIVASCPPFGVKNTDPLQIKSNSGESISLQDDLGNLVLVAASLKLKEDGIGIFIVPSSFFLSKHSVKKRFPDLGLGIEAALEFPSGTFAPLTNIQSYLVLIRRAQRPRMFVGLLSNDTNTNRQVISNLKHNREGATLELGRFVDPLSFAGLAGIRVAERFIKAEGQYGPP